MADEATPDRDQPQDDGTLTIGTASDAIGKLGLLSSDGPDDREAEEDGVEDTGEESGDDIEDLEVEDDFEDDDDELSDDEVDDEAEDEAEDSEPSPTYTVKVDGEEVEVTLDELQSGYSRTESFTRKSMELAEQRKDLQTQAQELTELQANYAQQLEVVQKALQVEEPDWAQVKKDNPGNYADIRDAFDARKQQLEAVQAEIQRTQQEAQDTQEAALQRQLEMEQEKLHAAIPEWVDPEVAEEETEKIIDTVTTYGFAPEDVGKVVDHRLVLLMRDAMRWRQHEEKSGQAKSKARKTRKKSTNLKPGNPDRSKSRKTKKASKAQKEAKKRLRETGRIDDAAAALSGLL